jgi:hypothetical protein
MNGPRTVTLSWHDSTVRRTVAQEISPCLSCCVGKLWKEKEAVFGILADVSIRMITAKK